MFILERYDDFPSIRIFNIRIITFYGLMYLIGFIICRILAEYIADEEIKLHLDSLLNYIILGTVIGGRLGYYILYDIDMSLSEIIAIWNGGMSFYGGFVGVTVAVLLFAYKYSINFFKITELCSIFAPIVIFFVRIGNFINQEAVGIVCKYGIIFQNYDNNIRIPSQLLEAILEGLVIFILNIYFRKNCTSRFLILYAISRIFCEYFREEDSNIILPYIKYGQLLAIPMFILGVILKLYKL